jgi:predicted Ser/Thr protein kinase
MESKEIEEIEYLIKWERNMGKSKRQIISILMDRGYTEKDAQRFTETFLGPITEEIDLFVTLQI